MKTWLSIVIVSAAMILAACGSKQTPAAGAPTHQAAAAPDAGGAGVEVDCSSYEHQVDLCRPTCEGCAASTPGNSCNMCAETCASKIFCEKCGDKEQCDAV